MATPTKIKESFTPNNIKDDYKEKLFECIPILKYNNLFGLVIEYCNELKSCEKTDKESYITNGVLSEILKILNQLKNEAINLSQIKNNNSKYIKKINNIDVNGLIEAIILFTVKYYDEDITVQLSRLNINNENMYITMNKAPGVTLAKYVKDLYETVDLPEEEKNNNFINILKLVADKLYSLQKRCGFIHGDFHADNILIDENENIYFIDFQFSIIRLPTKNINNNIILCGTESVNLKRKDIFDIKSNPELKAIDLFHLIIYFYKLNTNKKIYNHSFTNIIEQIKDNCITNKIKLKNQNKYDSPHDFTSSYNFIKKDNNLKNLYPENFRNMELRLNNKLVFYNNRNHNRNHNHNQSHSLFLKRERNMNNKNSESKKSRTIENNNSENNNYFSRFGI